MTPTCVTEKLCPRSVVSIGHFRSENALPVQLVEQTTHTITDGEVIFVPGQQTTQMAYRHSTLFRCVRVSADENINGVLCFLQNGLELFECHLTSFLLIQVIALRVVSVRL